MSSRFRPVALIWNAERGVFVPNPRYLELCRRQCSDGAEYVMDQVTIRSMKSHSHYFAWLHEAWMNLPEQLSKKYPTEDHLRSTALVLTGWCDQQFHPCDTVKHCLQVAAIVRRHSPFAVITIDREEKVVYVRSPRSQSIAPPPLGMTNEEFKKSKQDVMDFVASLNPGLSQEDLARQAELHAPRDRGSR